MLSCQVAPFLFGSFAGGSFTLDVRATTLWCPARLLLSCLGFFLLARTFSGHYTYGMCADPPSCCFPVWLFCWWLLYVRRSRYRIVVSCQAAPFLFFVVVVGSLALDVHVTTCGGGAFFCQVAAPFLFGFFTAGSLTLDVHATTLWCPARLLLSCLAVLLQAPLR